MGVFNQLKYEKRKALGLTVSTLVEQKSYLYQS